MESRLLMRARLHSEAGFTMIELMIAIFVLMMVLSAGRPLACSGDM